MSYRHITYALIVALLAFPGAAGANALQDHRSIQAAAESFITGVVKSSHGAEPVVNTGSLDSRLRLARCDIPLEAFQPSGNRILGNTTVGVRCTGAKTWTLYVPISVSLFDEVVVAAQPMSRGHLLAAGDLKLSRRDLAQMHTGYYTEISQAIGKQASRNISIDSTVTSQLVREPLAVKRGQRVSLVAETAGLEVRMTGEAMSDGVAGERIKVRNLRSKRVLDGVVMSATTIKVAL